MTRTWLGVARAPHALLVVVAASLLGACLSHTRSDDAGPSAGDSAFPDTCVCEDAASAPEVEAVLSSVTLADDCALDTDSDCAGDCCQQTSLQLQFSASSVGTEVAIEIVSVSLFTEDGAFLQNLTLRDPRTFDMGSYLPWDERIAPSESLHVAYDATSPDWTVIDPGHRFGTRYRVQVVVRIDGAERTLELSPVMRQTDLDT